MAVNISILKPTCDCGVCEQPGATVVWYNHLSNYAHSECIEKIQEIEGILSRRLDTYFPNHNVYRSSAHGAVIRAIKNEIGNISILTFLETEGSKKLKTLCRSNIVTDTIQKQYDFSYAGPFRPELLPHFEL